MFIQAADRHAVEPCKLPIEHHPMPAQNDDGTSSSSIPAFREPRASARAQHRQRGRVSGDSTLHEDAIVRSWTHLLLATPPYHFELCLVVVQKRSLSHVHDGCAVSEYARGTNTGSTRAASGGLSREDDEM